MCRTRIALSGLCQPDRARTIFWSRYGQNKPAALGGASCRDTAACETRFSGKASTFARLGYGCAAEDSAAETSSSSGTLSPSRADSFPFGSLELGSPEEDAGESLPLGHFPTPFGAPAKRRQQATKGPPKKRTGTSYTSPYGVFALPQKRSLNFLPTMSRKCRAVACHDPGGDTAAKVDVADASSTANQCPDRQSTEAAAVGSRDAATTAALSFSRAFLPNLLRPTARIVTSDGTTHRLLRRNFLPPWDHFGCMGRIGR